MVAASFIASLIGTPAIMYVVSWGTWRWAFILVVLPAAFAALSLIFFGLSPLKDVLNKFISYRRINTEGFWRTFSNKSAAKCILGSLFFTCPASSLFIVAFLRQQFLLSNENITYITLIVIVILIFGSLFAGRIGNKIGVRLPTIVGTIVSGVFVLFLFFAPNLWIALVCEFSQALFGSIATSTYSCLVLDQVPESRDVVMSFYRFFSSISGIIIPVIGGTLLFLFSYNSIKTGYHAIGIMLCFLNLISAIMCLSARDLYKNHRLSATDG